MPPPSEPSFLPSSLMDVDYRVSAYRLFDLMAGWAYAADQLRAEHSRYAEQGDERGACHAHGAIIATEEIIRQVRELLTVSIPPDSTLNS